MNCSKQIYIIYQCNLHVSFHKYIVQVHILHKHNQDVILNKLHDAHRKPNTIDSKISHLTSATPEITFSNEVPSSALSTYSLQEAVLYTLENNLFVICLKTNNSSTPKLMGYVKTCQSEKCLYNVNICVLKKYFVFYVRTQNESLGNTIQQEAYTFQVCDCTFARLCWVRGQCIVRIVYSEDSVYRTWVRGQYKYNQMEQLYNNYKIIKPQ